MSITRRTFLGGVFLGAVVMSLFFGGAGQRDAISQTAKADKNPPGIAETRAIAEEGFIYGLPIVMNYAVMYDYIVDKNSGQWKAPFNEIFNEHRVFTYKDSPGQDKESNWLPAPNGPIYLVMRLCWPKETPPSVLPAGGGNVETTGGRTRELTWAD